MVTKFPPPFFFSKQSFKFEKGTYKTKFAFGMSIFFSLYFSHLSGNFDDAEERSFYEDLPDLRALLPAILFEGASAANVNAAAATPEESRTDSDTTPAATAATTATTTTAAAATVASAAPEPLAPSDTESKTETEKDEDTKVD